MFTLECRPDEAIWTSGSPAGGEWRVLREEEAEKKRARTGGSVEPAGSVAAHPAGVGLAITGWKERLHCA